MQWYLKLAHDKFVNFRPFYVVLSNERWQVAGKTFQQNG
jgi:hypothetical protein